MNNGFNKIFWGFIFATFHINFGMIQLLPSFVGYIIMYFGIYEAVKAFNNEEFEKSSKYCSTLAFMSFLASAIPFAISEIVFTSSSLNTIWVTTFNCIEIIMIFKLLNGFSYILKRSNNDDLAREYDNKASMYVMLYSAVTIAININTIFLSAGIGSAGAFSALGIRIWIMILMRRISKIDVNEIITY